MADLRSGAYDIALVVGVELEKTVPVIPPPSTWRGRVDGSRRGWRTLPVAVDVRAGG